MPDPISIIEDLDPEPPLRHGFQRRELYLGLILLVAVLAFVGWQWWLQETQPNYYRAAQEAVARHDWNAAQNLFEQAGSYRDATQQAQHAREQVETRDRLYDLAQQHTAGHEWLEALSDIRAAAEIQPDYRDLKAREQTVLEQVYTDALSGTLALRASADPPGLYYRSASDWVYLADSDAYTTLIATGDSNNGTPAGIVYDVPDVNWVPPLGRNPSSYNPTDLVGRHLLYAHFTNGKFDYTRLSLSPNPDISYTYSDSGLWGFDYTNSYSDFYQVIYDGLYNMNMAYYQSYDGSPATAITTSYTTPISRSVMIADGPHTGDTYLMAEHTRAPSLGPNEDTVVKLYLVTIGKADTQLIYTLQGGGIRSAQLSPDGRYVVVQTYTFIDRFTEKQTIVLIDAQGTQAPLLLRSVSVIHEAYRDPNRWLGSTFVRDGAFAGDLVLSEYHTDHTQIQLIDPSNLATLPQTITPLADIQVPGTDVKSWVIGSQNKDGLVIAGHMIEGDGLPPTNNLNIVTIPAQGTPGVRNIEAHSNSSLNAMRSTGGTLSWVSYEYPGTYINEPITQISVRSLQGDTSYTLPTGGFDPTIAFTQTFTSTLSNTRTFSLGSTFFTYTLDNQLHARTYNGSVDIILEADIPYIHDLNHFTPYWAWLR